VGLPNISIQGQEPPIRLDHNAIVASIMIGLADLATRNPEWLIEQLKDLDAITVIEARGMHVSDKSADDVIRAVYEIIGHPVVEVDAGTAIQWAKRLVEAADYISAPGDRAARAAFRLREAQALVSAAAVENTAAQAERKPDAPQTGTHEVRTLADSAPAAFVDAQAVTFLTDDVANRL
jgi:hypothetical protein